MNFIATKINKSNIKEYDINHPLYGTIMLGDRIKWSGDYFDGYNTDGSYKNKHLKGINIITEIYTDYNIDRLCMRLDNHKIFCIVNLKTGEWDMSWKKFKKYGKKV